MKTLQTTLALVAAFALAAGCQPAGDTNIQTETAQVKAQHTGPEAKLIEALFSLELRADQQAVLEEQVTLTQASLQPVKQAVADLMREAAREIRTGQVNVRRIRVLLENLKGDYFKARPQIIKALNTVHKTLDPSQRQALVDKLRRMHEERMARHAEGGDDLHPGPGPGHHHPHGKRHKMRRVAEKLGLSRSQRGQIKDVIHRGIAAMRQGEPSHEERRKIHRTRIQEAVQSFLSSNFDAAKLPFLDRPAGPGLEKLDKVLQMGQLILPILSDEQRDKIATHLEFRADIVAPAMD